MPVVFRKCVILFIALTALIVQAGESDPSSPPFSTGGEAPPDPAAELEQPPGALTPADEKTCRTLFKQLASDDFDAREQALNSLIAHGPAVLPLAKDFEKDSDAEIAAQARDLYIKMLCSYDGYLPVSSALRKALAKKVTTTSPLSREKLDELARSNGVKIVYDPRLKPLVQEFPEHKVTQPLGELLAQHATMSGGVGMARGDVYLFATPETFGRLALTRRTFDWRALQLDHDTATDLVAALQPLFPQHATEMHAGGEMLVLQGVEAAIPRMARIVALLTPGAADGAWPAPENAPTGTRDLEQDLSAPVSLNIASESPATACEQLAAALHPVAIVSSGDPGGDPIDLKLLKKYSLEARQDATLMQFQELTDIRLKLRDIPLGLALRWVERRSRFLNDNQIPRLFGYEVGPGGRLQFRIQFRPRPELDNAIGGADVAFLYPADAKLNWNNDKTVCDKIWKVLDPHLQVFPSFAEERGLAVIHGRMLISAPWATAQRAIEVIREWRDSGKPPAAPEWHVRDENRLAASVEWDGQGLSGGRVLARLSDLSGMNILMEESADGRAPDFQLSRRDAALLPPGQHTVRELLDDLAAKVHADWSIQLGAIVLSPKAEPQKDATTAENGGGF